MFVVSHSLLALKRRASDRFFTFSGRSHYSRKVLLDHTGRSVLSSIVLYFFGLERHNCTKKDPPGVSFPAFFSDSLNKKRRRVLPLSCSLKLNDIGHRQNDTFPSICYPRQACPPKITGVPARNGRGNKTVIMVVSAVCRSWTWHSSAFVSGWGFLILFCTSLHGFWLSYLTPHLLIALSPWPLLIWCQILPNPLLCHRYVQEKLASASLPPPSDVSHKIFYPSLSHVDDVGNIMAHPRSRLLPVDSSSLSRKVA